MGPAVSQVVLLAQESSDPSFWQDHGDEISAAITLVVAIIVAFIVDRLVIGRGSKVAERISDTGMTRTAHTRLRVIRRLVFVLILVIGIALALSQFAQIKRLATGILASTAVLGLVIGLAARQTLGNLVAGVMLAVTQPIRIGDRITFEEITGRVDDLTLSYTYIDPGNGDLVVVPNEQIVSGAVTNHSTGDRSAPVTVQALLPPDADLERAREVLKRDAGAEAVRVSDWTPDGIVMEIKVGVGQDRTRVGDEDAALRERAQRALQAAGLLSEEA